MQLLSEEVFDFSRGELTQSKIKELKNSLNRYVLPRRPMRRKKGLLLLHVSDESDCDYLESFNPPCASLGPSEAPGISICECPVSRQSQY